jgi:hypothetical protein
MFTAMFHVEHSPDHWTRDNLEMPGLHESHAVSQERRCRPDRPGRPPLALLNFTGTRLPRHRLKTSTTFQFEAEMLKPEL